MILFELVSFIAVDEQKHDEGMEVKNCETRLRQEFKDWKVFLYTPYQDLKQPKQKHPVVDKSILPPAELGYLQKAENFFFFFIRESMEFRQEALLLMEYDYAELMEMVEGMESMCDHEIEIIKVNKINKCLPNIKVKKNI